MSIDEEYLQHLMRTISHDMGGTLRTAVGFSKLILENGEGELDDKTSHWLSLIREEGEKTQEKLIALSRYARLYDIPDNLSDCDLGSVCGQSIKALSLGERYPNFSLMVGDLPVMAGYERLWEDLFYELIVNSAKFSGGSSVNCTISAESEGGELKVIVRDNGPGLSSKEVVMALQPFRTVTKGMPAGVGMGLSIVKRIAEIHDGKLQLYSIDDGVDGLVAMIILPERVLVNA